MVEFDPEADVAVLRVPDLDAPALEFGSPAGPGDDSVVVGYPGNGPYTISPSRVREKINARGLDIYDEDSVVREVYSVRGIVREGNSGGPLLDADGNVIGMVFARSATDEETGYALTRAEIRDELQSGANSTTRSRPGSARNKTSARNRAVPDADRPQARSSPARTARWSLVPWSRTRSEVTSKPR